jgi:hypothetical protein
MIEDIDVVMGACRGIARKVRTAIVRELRTQAVGDHLQSLLFFGALSHLVIEVFTVAPTHTTPTKDERRTLFEEFMRVTREGFEKTLEEID